MSETPRGKKGLRLAPPPPTPHDCRRSLPWSPGGYGSTGQPEGTVALCPCGKAWVCLPCYQSLGPTTHWRPVRWYSRREFRQRASSLCAPATTEPQGQQRANG